MSSIDTTPATRLLARLAIVGLLAGWVACGSKDAADPNLGTGGASDGGGGSGGSGGSGTGTGAMPGCVEASSCGQEGAKCTADDGCCQCTFTCIEGSWANPSCPGCEEPACPIEAPDHGDPCNYCTHPVGFPCVIEDCAGSGVTTATCTFDDDDGTYEWVAPDAACEPAPPCGPDATDAPCPDGELCVIAEEVVGPTSNVTYSCENNPCAPGATTCDCAVSLCEDTNAPLCTEATPRTVSCSNGAQ